MGDHDLQIKTKKENLLSFRARGSYWIGYCIKIYNKETDFYFE
jgi:hypothetical protein